MIDKIDIVGLVAGLTTTFSFIPQVIKTIRTKDTSSISLVMYVFYVSGIMLWFVYASLIHQPVIMFTNSFSFILGTTMLIMKIKYK